MLKTKYIKYFLFATISSLPGLAAANITSISTKANNWEADENARLSDSSGGLKVKSMANNIWLEPKKSFPYTPETSLVMDYDLRSGNIIVQANWFDANGNYLETTRLGMDTSENTRAQFPIIPQEAGESAKTYRIKIWLEAELPRFQLKSLSIQKASSTSSQSMLKANNDFEPSENMSASITEDSMLEFELTGDSSSGNIHTKTRYNIKSDNSFNFALTKISANTSFSIQLLFWDAQGTYLGHKDILKDATKPESPQTIQITGNLVPKNARAYSIKFWLAGQPGSSAKVRIEKN